MTHTPTTPLAHPAMGPPVDPTAAVSRCLIAELAKSLDMTAEFLRLASPRVRTELSAYLADFHPHLERDELIDLLGNRAMDLFRLAHHQSQPGPYPDRKEISS